MVIPSAKNLVNIKVKENTIFFILNSVLFVHPSIFVGFSRADLQGAAD